MRHVVTSHGRASLDDDWHAAAASALRRAGHEVSVAARPDPVAISDPLDS